MPCGIGKTHYRVLSQSSNSACPQGPNIPYAPMLWANFSPHMCIAHTCAPAVSVNSGSPDLQVHCPGGQDQQRCTDVAPQGDAVRGAGALEDAGERRYWGDDVACRHAQEGCCERCVDHALGVGGLKQLP